MISVFQSKNLDEAYNRIPPTSHSLSEPFPGGEKCPSGRKASERSREARRGLRLTLSRVGGVRRACALEDHPARGEVLYIILDYTILYYIILYYIILYYVMLYHI